MAAIVQYVIVLQERRKGRRSARGRGRGRGRRCRREIRWRGIGEWGGKPSTYLRLRATWTTIRGTNAIAPVHDPGLPCLNHTRPAVGGGMRDER